MRIEQELQLDAYLKIQAVRFDSDSTVYVRFHNKHNGAVITLAEPEARKVLDFIYKTYESGE